MLETLLIIAVILLVIVSGFLVKTSKKLKKRIRIINNMESSLQTWVDKAGKFEELWLTAKANRTKNALEATYMIDSLENKLKAKEFRPYQISGVKAVLAILKRS